MDPCQQDWQSRQQVKVDAKSCKGFYLIDDGCLKNSLGLLFIIT